jgi:hypothetical protein
VVALGWILIAGLVGDPMWSPWGGF